MRFLRMGVVIGVLSRLCVVVFGSWSIVFYGSSMMGDAVIVCGCGDH